MNFGVWFAAPLENKDGGQTATHEKNFHVDLQPPDVSRKGSRSSITLPKRVYFEFRRQREREREGESWAWKEQKGCNFDSTTVNNLDDGCLMHIFSFLPPIPDRFNTALVCQRWCYLACHPRLWLRVERSIRSPPEPGVFSNIETAILAARPGDTILIEPGRDHIACNIQIKKPLCLIGGGELPDDTVLVCSRGSDSALEFLSTCKVANLTVRAELGCCMLHRSGRLTIEGCILQCEEDPLDYLSCPIVSTAGGSRTVSSAAVKTLKANGDSVSVLRTQIEGGNKAVSTCGTLALRRVRVIYARTAIFFWFDVDHQ